MKAELSYYYKIAVGNIYERKMNFNSTEEALQFKERVDKQYRLGYKDNFKSQDWVKFRDSEQFIKNPGEIIISAAHIQNKKMKLKFFKAETPKRRGLKAGSPEASAAAKKAAKTRRENLLAKGIQPKTKPTIAKEIKKEVIKTTYKKLDESNYQKIVLNTPVTIYVHKTLNTLYITPNETQLK